MSLNLPQVQGDTLAEAITAFYLKLADTSDIVKVEQFAKAVQDYVYTYSTMPNTLLVSTGHVRFLLGSLGSIDLPGVQIEDLATGRYVMIALTPVSMMIPPGIVIWSKST
jgi:hypothetical protein